MAQKFDVNYSSNFFEQNVNARVEKLIKENVLERFLAKDHTFWDKDPNEISNRLAWIDSPEKMLLELDAINEFVHSILQEGYDRAVLLGMGGSSLAPEVFINTFGLKPGFLNLTILDTTDPSTIFDITKSLDLDKTLFIVSSKSGSTVETISLFKYYYSLIKNNNKTIPPGENFIAITDPGSKLEKIGFKLGFKKIFINDPNIGGRFSALSYFGLIPAALIGVDIKKLLFSAQEMKNDLFSKKKISNSGLLLGSFLGEGALLKKEKLNIILSEEISSFGDWVEQLIAESTGKSGKGILPLLGNKINNDINKFQGNIFVSLSLNHKINANKILDSQKLSPPHFIFELENIFHLGGQFFLWMFAISIAGKILNIQPFNQPNVESAKISTREVMELSKLSGELPSINSSSYNIAELKHFLKTVKENDYVSIQAYIPFREITSQILNELKNKIAATYNVSVTLGYGPRYLHSTGQLHKGDSGNGHFIQFISTPPVDINIPDDFYTDKSTLTFANLKLFQAIGDSVALKANNRKVIIFQIKENQIKDLENWIEEI